MQFYMPKAVEFAYVQEFCHVKLRHNPLASPGPKGSSQRTSSLEVRMDLNFDRAGAALALEERTYIPLSGGSVAAGPHG